MSEKQIVRAIKTSEGADEQIEQLDEQRRDPAAKESYIKALTPVPETPVADAVRKQVEAVAEVSEVKTHLSFEEAMEWAPEFRNLKKLYNFAKQCRAAKLIHIRHLGGSRWIAVPEREAEDKAASKDLADAINTQRRKLVDEKKATRKPKRKGPKVSRKPVEKLAELSNEDILSTIHGAKNRNELGKVLRYCEQTGKNKTGRDEVRDVMLVLPIEGVDGSVEIAEAFNQQYDSFAERAREKAAIAKEKELEKHVQWAIGRMEEAKSTPHLETIIKRELGHMVVLKPGRGRYDWTVHLREGKPEAYRKVAEEANRIKKEVGEKARQEAELRKSREDVEGLLRRARR